MTHTQQRRLSMVELLQEGQFLMLFAGEPIYESLDETYPFSVNRNFYYFTGLDIPHAILVMFQQQGKPQIHLFIERYDDFKAKWMGKMILESEAQRISGIASILYLDELDSKMTAWLKYDEQPVLYLDLQRQNDMQMRDLPTWYGDKMKQLLPQLQVRQAHQMLAKLRLIKSEDEVEKLRMAVDITQQGVERMMKTVQPGMMEYQLEAEFNYALQMAGCRKTSFKSIIAGGENATVLHYNTNNCELQDETLVLCDLGATYQHYHADITRTFPVNGTFTPRQKELYELVLEASLDVIAHAVVGTTLKELNQRVIDLYQVRLQELGLLRDGKTVSDYYYHSVSHMLGLDTHDVTLRDYVLQEGNIITVEPGLYVAEENIGIRIEDDILITKDGPINLSSKIMKSVDEIEAFMKSRQ